MINTDDISVITMSVVKSSVLFKKRNKKNKNKIQKRAGPTEYNYYKDV